MTSDLAKRIVAHILDDLTDRSALDGAWYGIDGDIQNEIREAWERKVDEALLDEQIRFVVSSCITTLESK